MFSVCLEQDLGKRGILVFAFLPGQFSAQFDIPEHRILLFPTQGGAKMSGREIIRHAQQKANFLQIRL